MMIPYTAQPSPEHRALVKKWYKFFFDQGRAVARCHELSKKFALKEIRRIRGI